MPSRCSTSAAAAPSSPSTSRARASGGIGERTISLEIGAVRLSERHPALLGGRALDAGERRALEAKARADASIVLAPFTAERGIAELIAVGAPRSRPPGSVGGIGDATTITGASESA